MKYNIKNDGSGFAISSESIASIAAYCGIIVCVSSPKTGHTKRLDERKNNFNWNTKLGNDFVAWLQFDT